MKSSKIKTCKYPKCTKEVPSGKSLFCIEHNRNLKDKRDKTIKIVGLLGGIAITGTNIAKNVTQRKYKQ